MALFFLFVKNDASIMKGGETMLNNILKVMAIVTMMTMIGSISWAIGKTEKVYKSMADD